MKRKTFTLLALLFFCFYQDLSAQNITRPNIKGPAGIEVNSFTGNLLYQRTDLVIPAQGMDLDITFSFNSSEALRNDGYGNGWTFAYNVFYSTDGNDIMIHRADSRVDTFLFNGSTYDSPAGIFDSLEVYQPSQYRLTSKNGTRYFFDDPNHQKLTSIKDRYQNEIVLGYTNSLLISITDSNGRTLSLSHTNGLLTQVTDPIASPARVLTYAFDSYGNMIKVTDPLGNEISYIYNAYMGIRKIIDKNGTSFRIYYDENHAVSRLISPLSDMSVHYNPMNNETVVTESVSQGAQQTIYTFDSTSNVVQITGNCCGFSILYGYGKDKNITSRTDANGNTTLYSYDDSGNLLTGMDPLSDSITYTYDSLFHQVTSVVDKKGFQASFAYDSVGNLLQINHPLGVTESFTYDNKGNRLSWINGKGDTTTYVYNTHGYLMQVNHPIGSESFTYDSVGNLTSGTDANGNTTQFVYDALDRRTVTINAQGDSSYVAYDGNNNVTSETDLNGNITTITYDKLNRPIAIHQPLGISNFFKYDERGNLIEQTDPNGNKTTYVYNSRNLLVSQTDALGFTRSYSYDGNGNLTAGTGNLLGITDANGNTTSYTYDPSDRPIAETYADGTTMLYTYDSAGNVASRTDQIGTVTTLSYDALDRLTLRDYPGNNDDAFSWDGAGRMLTAVNSHASISFSYDTADRLLSENLNGKTTAYAYQTAVNKRTITYPGGRVIEEDRDQRDRLVSIKEGPASIASFVYDPGNRLTQRNYSNGTQTTFQYNQNAWITNLQHSHSGTLLAGFNYDHDQEGNRQHEEKIHCPTHSERYSYDNIYRLAEFKKGTLSSGNIPAPSTQTQYNYDALGNRTTVNTDGAISTYTANNVNEYTSSGSPFTPLHDANGNLTFDSAHTYSFDHENRLVSVDNDATATYIYGPLGRRLQKRTATDTIHYYYDGDRVIEERNEGDAVTATYVYGSWIDEVLTMDRNNNTYYYHHNALGSVVAVSDATGAVTERYEYNAYGKVSLYNGTYANLSSSAIGNPYFFTGRRMEEETGLYYYRARHYDPVRGRFLQRDPIGIWEDEINQGNGYGYVGNNPPNWVDPSGLYIVSKDAGGYTRNFYWKNRSQWMGTFVAEPGKLGVFYLYGNKNLAVPIQVLRKGGANWRQAAQNYLAEQRTRRAIAYAIRKGQDPSPYQADYSHSLLSYVGTGLKAAFVDPVVSSYKSGVKHFTLAIGHAQKGEWGLCFVATLAGLGDAAQVTLAGVGAGSTASSTTKAVSSGIQKGKKIIKKVLSKISRRRKFRVQGTAYRPTTTPWRRSNRTYDEDEAIELARSHGVEIPDDIQFHFMDDNIPEGAHAAYHIIGETSPGGVNYVHWDNFYNAQGRIPVRIRPDVLTSEERIVGVIAHEMHELNSLRRLFRESGGSMMERILHDHITPHPIRRLGRIVHNLHSEAWDIADALVRAMRGQ